MRIIDADALYKDICDDLNQMTKIGIMVDGEWLWAKLNDALENAPTIEAERPKGEWIDKGDYAECSNCGANSGTQFDGVEPVPRITDYCPNCGAKMEGAKE